MDVTNFNHCRGIYELGGFGPRGVTTTEVTRKIGTLTRGKLVVTTVNAKQKKTKAALIGAGFREIQQFANPGGSTVTMLSRTV